MPFSIKKLNLKLPAVSMKVPLFLLLLGMGFLPMFILGKMMTGSFMQTQIDQRMIEVQNQCLITSDRLTRSGYMNAETKDAMMDKELDTIGDIFSGRVVVVDRNFRVIKDSFKLAEGRLNIAEAVLRCFQGESTVLNEEGKHYFAVTTPIYSAMDPAVIDGVLLMTVSTENITANTADVSEKISFFQVVAFWLLALSAMLALCLLMKPFERLQVVLDAYAVRPEPCMLRRPEPACPDLPLYPPPITPGPPCWPQCPAGPDPCGWPARG